MKRKNLVKTIFLLLSVGMLSITMAVAAEVTPPVVEVKVGPFLLGHDGNTIQSVSTTDDGLPLITVQAGSAITVRQNPDWVGGIEYLYFWDEDETLFSQTLSENPSDTPAMGLVELSFNRGNTDYDMAADIVELMGSDFGMYTYHMIFRTEGAATPPVPSVNNGAITAVPNRSRVQVNGQVVAFDAYTINENNYFKLRDLALVLNGSDKQFEVTWDGKNNAINLVSGHGYTAVGGELALGDGAEKVGIPNTATIYLNGQPIQLTAYTINNNNYFKLRDVGQTFDFDVTWDGARNMILIDTGSSYTPD